MGGSCLTAALPEKVYRVTRSDYARTADDALSGVGGLFDEGRWHSKGRKIVYTSESSTLCLVERLVHADEWIAERHPDRVMLTIIVPPVSWVAVTSEDLSAHDPGWRAEGNLLCRRLGDAWLTRQGSCALLVPSAVNPADHNILFNPLHPEFPDVTAANAALKIDSLEPDERIVQLASAYRDSLASR